MRKPRRNVSPAAAPRPTEQHDISATLERREIWQGPLPPPAILEQFRQMVPEAPERIFRQWEIEADHRRDYEMTALRGALGRDRRGQYAAILFSLAALAVSVVALVYGYPATAGVICGTTIVGVVGAFLYQRVTKQ